VVFWKEASKETYQYFGEEENEQKRTGEDHREELLESLKRKERNLNECV